MSDWMGAGWFAVVALLQLWYFTKSRSLSSGTHVDRNGIFLDSLRNDIVHRASRGESPDWIRYFDEFDRHSSPHANQVRIFATAALATGIGGTMSAFILQLVVDRIGIFGGMLDASEGFDQVLEFTMWALLSSVGGVLNHLLITLIFVRRIDMAHQAFWIEVKRDLQITSQRHPPQQKFIEVLRASLVEAFEHAITSLPKLFEELQNSIDRLREVTTEHSAAINRGARDLRATAQGLEAVSKDLESAMGRLEGAASLLSAVPKQIEHVERVAAKVIVAVADVPPELERAAKVAAILFGREASQHVVKLTRVLREGNQVFSRNMKRDIESMRISFVNNTSTVIENAVENILNEIDQSVLQSIRDIGNAFNNVVTEIPEHASGFVDSLSRADLKLHDVVGRISEATEEFRRIASASDEYRATLLESVEGGIEKGVKPLLVVTSDVVDRLDASHDQVNKAVRHLIESLQRLVRYLSESPGVGSTYDEV